MTHAELRAEYPSATSVEPTECAGEVEMADLLLDDCYEVEIWRCLECGNTVVIDLESGTCRNDYPRQENWRLA